MRHRHRRLDRQLGAGCTEIVAVITAQHERAERIADGQGPCGRIDAGEPPITRETEARPAGLVQNMPHEVRLTVRRRNAPLPIQLQPAEIQVAARAERQPLHAVVACQSPAWRPRTELPRRGGELAQAARELLHLAFGNERVVGGSERRWQHRSRDQRGRIGGNVDPEREAMTVPALARDLLGLFARMTGGACDRVCRCCGHRWPYVPAQRGIARDLVLVVYPLVAHRHLQKRSGGRDRVHRNQPGQPPPPGPQPVVDRDEPDLDADRFDEAWNVFVVRIADILLEIERTRRTNQRPHHRMGGLVDPERSRHEPEVEPAGNDSQLAQDDRAPVGEHDDARIARREPVVRFAAGRERMAELHIAVLTGGIPRAVPSRIPEPDSEPVVRRIERVVARIAFQIFRHLAFRDGRGHRLPRAQDVDLRDGVAAPVDAQRDLAAVQHAVAS